MRRFDPGPRLQYSQQLTTLEADWAATAEPVPYAELTDPQSLNLYAYVRNNPLGGVDADGHIAVATPSSPLWYNPLIYDDAMVDSDGCAMGNPAACVILGRNPPSFFESEEYIDAVESESGTNANAAAGQAEQGIAQAQQQSGPFTVTDPNSSEFQRDSTTLGEDADWPLIGSGECVASTEHFATGLAGSTTDQWREGIPLVLPDGTLNPAVKPNTAIATFDSNGRYPSGEHKNSGIFLGPNTKYPGSAKILDQWNPKSVGGVQVRDAKPPSMRTMLPTGAGFSDNPQNYYVIMLAR